MESSEISAAATAAALGLRAVGDITGLFFVPAYQRGYRWGEHEVTSLLDDIWRNTEAVYCLQPVVVKRRGDDEWELIDGQQRLTTLWLVLRYMETERLKNAAPPYSIRYETRARSEAYLRDLREADRGANIDFFHLYNAHDTIRKWFERHGAKRQFAADKLYMHLHETVKVIWYEVPRALDSTSLFTRLNVGRIPLTNAELVKAVLLARGTPGALDRQEEVAAQWDTVERDLRDDELWAFLTNAPSDRYPTRIELLFDILAGTADVGKRPRYATFDALRGRIEADRKGFWRDVLGLHATAREWFEDRDLYHKIGFLVAEGTRLSALVAEAKGTPRTAFNASLVERIREATGLTRAEAEDLRYTKLADLGPLSRLLLLMNVEAVRRLRDSSERYSFRAHKRQSWSLEHIHAQQAERLSKKEQWQEWLRRHREALAGLPPSVARDALAARIDAACDTIDRDRFDQLAAEVATMFSAADGGDGTTDWVHSLANLALLSSGANSALGNSVFEVKRRAVLDLDRAGAFIPICTRRVFLKYFTGADAQQVHFWSPQDRGAYLDAMFNPTDGLLKDYVHAEAAK